MTTIQDTLGCGLAVVGLLVVLVRYVPGLLHFFWAYLLRPRTNVWRRYGGPGAWAIVTGASDGIGFAYAQVLAGEGFGVIMVARNKEKLATKREEIIKVYPKADIRIVKLDFNTEYSDPALYTALLDEIKGKDIAILINNVGIGNAHEFDTYPLGKIREIVKVTATSFIFTSRMILPTLLKRGRKAALVSISSATGMKPWPYFSIYGSSKSFMNTAMKSLSMEYRGSNVDFMDCITGEVISGTHQQGSVASVSSEQCVRGQLRFLGYEELTYGHIVHYLTCGLDFEFMRRAIGKSMSADYDKMWKAAEAGKVEAK